MMGLFICKNEPLWQEVSVESLILRWQLRLLDLLYVYIELFCLTRSSKYAPHLCFCHFILYMYNNFFSNVFRFHGDFWSLNTLCKIPTMRFNNKELVRLAHDGIFDKEGPLLMKDKPEGLFKKGEGILWKLLTVKVFLLMHIWNMSYFNEERILSILISHKDWTLPVSAFVLINCDVVCEFQWFVWLSTLYVVFFLLI